MITHTCTYSTTGYPLLLLLLPLPVAVQTYVLGARCAFFTSSSAVVFAPNVHPRQSIMGTAVLLYSSSDAVVVVVSVFCCCFHIVQQY